MEGKLWLSIFLGTFFLTMVEIGSSVINVRLADQSAQNAGRVEVYYQGTWRYICDSGWDLQDATVICRMLGYNQGAAAAIKGMLSYGNPWLSDLSCRGVEASLEDCPLLNWGEDSCSKSAGAGVVCQSGQNASVAVRLVGGATPNQGRVEVRYHGIWGTICKDLWGLAGANVVCRMLKYGKASSAGTATVKGSGPILLSELICRGSEKSLEHCHFDGWGKHDCDHDEDASVTCDNETKVESVSVRLTGEKSYYAEVEVNYKGIWRPVCDDTWDISDAHVVCRMLGFKAALAAIKQCDPKPSSLWMGGVGCRGDEASISECYHLGWNNNRCRTNKRAEVICGNTTEVKSSNLAVRLMNGSTPNNGRVDVRYHGVWGTVCGDNWDLADAHVVCRMLNYSKASWAGKAKVSGSGPILLDNTLCRGVETSLIHCFHAGWGQSNCAHSEDVGVTCENITREESSIAVSLVGKDHNQTGFVEVKYNGTWRPVCDDTWDLLDAHVICRMLGYQGTPTPIRQYRKGVNGLWMGGVECSGDEVSISQCYHRGWTNTRCPGNYYAGVRCGEAKLAQQSSLPPVEVRLEDRSSSNSGRVAVRYGNVWGTICNRGLDINDAKVICRMLGYPGASKVYPKFTFRPGNGTIWLSNLECNGTENSIVECRHPGWGQTTCNHDDDAGIMCNPKVSAAPTNNDKVYTYLLITLSVVALVLLCVTIICLLLIAKKTNSSKA